jgi:uncharacterized DUF497 family protein
MFDWDQNKNELLKKERGITFEEIVFLIENDGVLAVENHPNQKKYPDQRIYVVSIDNYAYLVPFIEKEGRVFLKTIIPSRKATRKYIDKGRDYETD